MMRIQFDERANAMSIRFRAGTSFRTEELKDGLIVDYNKTGKVVAVEVLNAKRALSDGGVNIPARILKLAQ